MTERGGFSFRHYNFKSDTESFVLPFQGSIFNLLSYPALHTGLLYFAPTGLYNDVYYRNISLSSV